MTALATTTAVALSAGQLQLIRQTVASDCNDAEFDLFLAAAQSAGLDPFRKQISPLVFNKDKPDKRRMAIVTTIDGLRVIANRSRRYRPDEEEAEYTFDEALKADTNPLGLVKAKVRVFIQDDRGAWHPTVGVAYWDEFAPLKDEWVDKEGGGRRKSGKQTLDTVGNWGRMPRVMLAKCAEAQALRKAFPEDMSALYEGAELDQARIVDELPSDVLAEAAMDSRLRRVAAHGIMFQLFPNGSLESIPVGTIYDRVMEVITEYTALSQIRWFEAANTQPLREFWARAGGDALELKKQIERIRAKLEAADGEASAA